MQEPKFMSEIAVRRRGPDAKSGTNADRTSQVTNHALCLGRLINCGGYHNDERPVRVSVHSTVSACDMDGGDHVCGDAFLRRGGLSDYVTTFQQKRQCALLNLVRRSHTKSN